METIEGLRKQIEAAEGLHDVVKTMKVLSAACIRQYEDAVRALGTYYRAVELGFHVLMRDHAGDVLAAASRGEPDGPPGLVVFGSWQGLCGRFNEQVVAAAGELFVDEPIETVMAVGEHVVAPLEAAGFRVTDRHGLPSSIAGITPSVQHLAETLQRWRSDDQIGRILLVHHKPRSGTASVPRKQQLLPLDTDWLRHLSRQSWPTRTLPIFLMDPDRLFSALVRQYLFVSLYRAIAESLASEHASRLIAMQAAEQNIEERMDQLQQAYRHMRQQLVTEELRDISSAFEALTGSG